MTEAQSSSASGSFAPLRQPMFAMLWAATVLGNIGSFMRDVASAWMATQLSSSPAAVAMVQTAATLPIFLLALPAGVLSDILDRRRLLIAIQLLFACVSASLLWLAHSGRLTLESLIVLTFIGGIGAAIMGPSWPAIVPELVPRAQLRSAVALNSLGVNIARSTGPAIGGLLMASFGAAAAYGADLLSYVFVIAALILWRRPPAAQKHLPEHFLGAFSAGLRYARFSNELHRVLLRAAAFFLFASAVWALLPLVARRMLGGDASFYGLLLGTVGAGAILGALLLPQLRQRLSNDGLLLTAALLAAFVLAALATAPPHWLALFLMLAIGMAWILALTTFNGVAQAVLPDWVRGRGLSIYLMVFNGSMAAGSLGWGLIAESWGLPATLAAAALGLALVSLVCHKLKLPAGEADLQASGHWPEPAQTSGPVENSRGPVMVQIEYQIARADMGAFAQAMQAVALERRRNGACAWGLAEHTSEPGRVIEWFLLASWAEHLRQHQRVSRAEAGAQAAALQFHQGPERPAVHHYLTMPPPAAGQVS